MNTIERITVAAVIAGVGAAGAPAVALAQQSGLDIWAQTCSNCHASQPARRYTADQWESIMTHMRIATRLPDADADAVLRFLKRGAKEINASETAQRAAPESAEPVAMAAASIAVALGLLPAQDASGARVYARECKACHGSRGKGDGRAGRTMDPRPTDISDPEYLGSHSDEEIARVIVEGSGEMDPLRDELTEAQVNAVVAYLRRLGELRSRKPESR